MSGIIDAATPGQALRIVLGMGWCPDIRDKKRLLAAAAGITPEQIVSLTVEDFTEAVVTRYLEFVERRNRGEPVSHILGYRDFWKHRFEVSGAVLDPRPETEALVAAALEAEWTRVLDLGTGSGCILLSLLAERDVATGVGTDLSEVALAVAGRNVATLELDSRASLIRSDWFEAVEGQFDLIVSNPPYIAAGEMDALQRELSFEPRMALTDEGDGLSAYRAICAGAGDHLTAGGWLMVEIGWQQGSAVMALFADAGLENLRIMPDLDGRDRVIVGRKPL